MLLDIAIIVFLMVAAILLILAEIFLLYPYQSLHSE